MAEDRESSAGFYVLVGIGGILLWIVGRPYVHHAMIIAAIGEFWVLEKASYLITVLDGDALKNARELMQQKVALGVGGYNAESLLRYRSFPQKWIGGIFSVGLIIFAIRFLRQSDFDYLSLPSLEDLEIRLSKRYYATRPVVGRQLHLRNPIEEGPGRYAYKPWEFAYRFGIVLNADGSPVPLKYKPKEVLLEKPPANVVAHYQFNEDACRQIFKHQLGERISSIPNDISRLPSEYRILIVACLSDIDVQFQDQTKNVHKWLKQAATSFWDIKALQKGVSPDKLPSLTRENIDMQDVDDHLALAFQSDHSIELLSQSAYANSLMVLLMEKSKLKSSDFRWLKYVNRSLWYAMNSVGNSGRIFPEAAGSASHALYELKTGSPAVLPYIEPVVRSLRDELIKHKWIGS